ncbi:hypothetical protein BH24CHL5_BH24CHL5_08550 [soil metagenome]
MINLALWVIGAGMAALAAWRIRGPLARMSELDQLAHNAERYDSWRGGRSNTAAGDQTTGADIMRQLLRRQVYMWAAIGVVGVVLVLAGFAVR